MNSTQMDLVRAACESLVASSFNRKAACVIASPDMPDESQLLATRDGIANLAVTLLEMLLNFDSAKVAREDKSRNFSEIRNAFYQLPTLDPYIVNCTIYATHKEFVDALAKHADTGLNPKASVRNDPYLAGGDT